MRSIIELLIALAISALFFFGLGFFLPKSAKIERTIEIERPAIHVFDAVNSTRRFLNWQPWTLGDQQADIDFSELPDGVGSRVSWQSKVPAVGNGSQEITEVVREKLIKMKLDLGLRQGLGTVTIEPKDVGVQVKFVFETEFSGLVDRYKGLYLDAEQGDKLTMGLTGLKAMLENSPFASDYSALSIEIKDLVAGPALQLTETAKGFEGQPLNVPRDRQVAIEKVQSVAASNKLTAGAPQFLEISRDPINYVVVFDITVPVEKTDGVRLNDRVVAATTPAGRYLVAKHIGARDSWSLPSQTRDQMFAFANVFDYQVAQVESGRKIFVEYLSPPETLEAQFETNVYIPIDN